MQELKDKICSVYRITVEQILTLTEVEVSTPEQDLQQQAYTWFRSLSINQMKEVCNKHHAPYYVSCIMGSHAKYASVGLQRKLITEVWEGEGKPEPQKVN